MESRIKNNIKLALIVILALFVVFFAGAMDGYIVEHLHSQDVIRSTEELGVRMNQELEKGNHQCILYLKFIPEEELVNINEELDGFFGNVESYVVLKKYDKYIYKVELDLQVSNNYYVYQAYKNGITIPNQNQQAVELLGVVNEILNTTITADMTDYYKELAIHDYIITHCSYGFLTGEDELNSYKAYGALVKGTAVCNGYAEAMQLLLMCCDVKSYIVVGEADKVAHAWNLVELDDNWYHVDVTWDDPLPDQGDKVSYGYMNINDTMIEYSHTWNEEAYPISKDLTYNYYMKKNGVFNGFAEYKSYIINAIESESPETISAMVRGYSVENYDFNFVFTNTNVKNVSYTVNDIGEYTVVDLVLTYY